MGQDKDGGTVPGKRWLLPEPLRIIERFRYNGLFHTQGSSRRTSRLAASRVTPGASDRSCAWHNFGKVVIVTAHNPRERTSCEASATVSAGKKEHPCMLRHRSLLREKCLRSLAFPVMDMTDRMISEAFPDIIRWELAILNVTTCCNSRCIMCSYVERFGRAGDLDAGAWKRIIRGFESFGLQTFIFTGGEPLLRQDFLEIARYCKGARAVNTNGILVDARLAETLAELFQVINVSIDGSNPAIYRRVRGEDRFQRVLRNVRLLKAAGARLKINYQINKHNYHDVVNMARIAQSLDIDLVFSLVVYDGFNRVFSSDRSLRLDIDFDRLKDLVEEALTYPRVSTWISLRDRLYGKLQRRCYAHIGGPIVDPAGRVFVCCGALPPIGNALEDDMETLWATYRGMRSGLLGMKAAACRDCLFYMGNFEYLQRSVKHVMLPPFRRRLKRHPVYLKYFLAGR